MNETVLDVLMYLFENFADQDCDKSPDQMALREELQQAGFGAILQTALPVVDGPVFSQSRSSDQPGQSDAWLILQGLPHAGQ